MPMPTEGPWPPKPYRDAYASYRDWDALYAGDPDRLREVYSNRGTSTTGPPSVRNHPGQYRGGIVGRLSRWLWGNPVKPGERDTRLHMPLPADLASTAAKLLFSEPPTFTSESEGAQDRIAKLEEQGLHSFLHGAAEAASAFGDVYLRPVIDRDVAPDGAIPTIVQADGALPLIRWGRLVEVTFWSEVDRNGNDVRRLFEHHERGRITYELRDGTPDRNGSVVPLAELPEGMLPDVDADGGQDTGLDGLDVVRVPNDGPQRQWRTDPTLKYFGRSDFSGAEQWFDAIDEAWTSWMRDLRLGKGRVIVPDVMLSDLGAGNGAAWDAEQEIYSTVNALPDQMGTSPLTATQFAIRFEEHRATIDALQELILRHAGLSSATVGDPPEGAQMTATETRSRERMSFLTGDRRIGIWRPRLAGYMEIHTAVERAAGLPGAVDPFRPDVEFADSISEDPKILAETASLLRAAEAASTRTLVSLVHPDWEKEDIDNEADAITSERDAQRVPDVESFGIPSGEPEE
ncbi:hypothetical protein GCM10027447_12500 [Glycomyces halotolerans]